ncbi:type II secretion system protein N [Paraglaciecola sp. MB-3u-78]|uniref:type II secretion system protein N n=1 Tax=Paraglaciecola sp. MB-3u-78 TaxID=2058332 RepID=UPI000C33F155|nr:type II secretion system protein N [Paraglaciecola sp. MB-3u-78]PKG97946.1 general secretion pathway protein GspN [Paraglaciecola sp. MB-3u-78]
MKSVLKWGSLCLVVYFIFLIVKLPAVHVLSKMQLPNGISVSGISGTIWNGNVQSAQAKGFPISDVNWSLSFFPLLLGEISTNIKAGDIRDVTQISVNGHVSFKGQHLKVENLLAYIPTNLAISLLPLPIPIEADGRFKVELNEVNYEAGCQTFTGKGQWLNANFTGVNGVIELGDFDADLSCQDGNVVLHVKQPNRFGLTAKATIPANLKFKINGRFKPEVSLPKEVHQAAQFFGKPDADGYYPIKF